MVKREYGFIDKDKRVMVLYDSTFPVYIVRGARNFLIDTGTAAKGVDFHNLIKRALAAVGDKEEKIHTLLLTHSHWDHVGSASYLQQKFGFDVYASERTVEVLQKEKAVAFIGRLNESYQKMVNDTSGTTVTMLQNMNAVKEGDRIPVDSESYFEVFATPGHTKCSVSYLLHPSRTVFLGDATGVREKDGKIKPIFLSSYSSYENSLQKLAALEAEAICFPHNTVIRGRERVHNYLQEALLRTHEIRDKIINKLKSGQQITAIGEALLMEEFSRPTLLGPRESMIINFEAMARSVESECLE